LASCLCAFPPCLGYLRHLFGVRVQKYLEALTSKTKPSKILVCMIYYPDETAVPGSWAGPVLGALGYNTNPAKLQALIRKGFEEATSNIAVEGTRIVPVPLFRVLDGKNTSDYVQRVEPSASGGRKMAEYILDAIRRDDDNGGNVGGLGDDGSNNHNYYAASPLSGTAAPTASYMRDRS